MSANHTAPLLGRPLRLDQSSLFYAAFSVAGSLLVFFVVLPLLSVFLGTSPSLLLETLADREVHQSIALTFFAGALATLCAVITGVPLAYLLARVRFRGKSMVEAIIDLPIVIPHTAAGVALLTVFGSRGVIGAPMAALDIRFTDSLPGIIVGMLFVGLPFLVNTARTAFSMIDQELERVALLDGASPWQAFRCVTLPLAWRGILAGSLMMWARSISEFGAVVILAYHPKIVPVLVYERFQGFGLQPAQAVAAILIVIAVAVFALLRRLLETQATSS
jgi:molybdate/tungstate transport system permease protein